MRKLKICDLGSGVPYAYATRLQQILARRVLSGRSPFYLLLLEHKDVFTLGRNANRENLLFPAEQLEAEGVDVEESSRGGDVTYHGPGQLVVYPIIDLGPRSRDVVAYVSRLEHVIMDTLSDFDIATGTDRRNRGIWIGESKIAALGVRVSRGITTHGFALNIDPDLGKYKSIVPCGLADAGVTSMAQQLSVCPAIDDVKRRVAANFCKLFDIPLYAVDTPGFSSRQVAH